MTSRAACVLFAVALLLATAEAGADAPVLELRGLAFVASQAGANEFVLEAERVRYRTAAAVAELEAVHIALAGEDGEMSFQMDCDRAQLNLATSDLVAEGNVRGRTAAGVKISTSRARYDSVTRLVSTTAPVRITRPNSVLTGEGFEYDVRKRRLRVLGGARMVQGP